MGAAAHDVGADAHRVVAAALLSIPAALGLAVAAQTCLKKSSVLGGSHKISYIPSKIFRERSGGRSANELPMGVVAEVEGREAPAGKLGLAVPGGHEQHEPVGFATEDPFELRCYLAVEVGRGIAGVCVLGKVN